MIFFLMKTRFVDFARMGDFQQAVHRSENCLGGKHHILVDERGELEPLFRRVAVPVEDAHLLQKR